jgi:hypothetical protein
MGLDVVLIAILVGGIALSAAYVRAEYRSWRQHGAAQRRSEAALRELHAASFSEQRDALLPSVLKLEGFGESPVANPDSSNEFAAARRVPGPPNSPRSVPLAERGKRARQRATQ